jgi:hypothetical protein
MTFDSDPTVPASAKTTGQPNDPKLAKLTGKLLRLVERFGALVKEQKDLDFRKCQWAREALDSFATERDYLNFLKLRLGLTDRLADEWLLRAHAGDVVADMKMFDQLGGFSQVRRIDRFDKRERNKILQTAISANRSIMSVIKELHPEPEFQPPGKVSPQQKAKMSDAEVLARFIAANADRLPSLPADLAVTVKLYVPTFKPRARA